MSRQLQRKSLPLASTGSLAETAIEALRAERFKDAIELFKKLVKHDPRSEWRAALSDAYIGRAKVLAAKGMFKEAEIVLGNAVASDGMVKDPLFLLQCLIRQGQFQKALAHALKYVGAGKSPAIEAGELPELTAALFLADPVRVETPADGQSARAEWIEAANAARDALNAWIEGKSEQEIDLLLARIPMRSPLKAVRLIVKSLLTAPHDRERACRLLDGVLAQSPFAPLRLAVEASFPGEPVERLDRWSGASAAQRSFAIEVYGGPAPSSRTLNQLFEAENRGPAALFAFLLKQAAHLPEQETRGACLDLLPRLPDRIAQFEKTFGPLPEPEKNRVLALSAETSQQWSRAEKYWRAMAAYFARDGSRQAKLSAGVIYRHLADLARMHEAIEGEGYASDPVAFYLKASLDADPDCLAALLLLLGHYRQNGEDKEWNALAEEAARRFPEESAVLLQAIDAAAARKAYKKAASFAQKLLTLDPINQPARQRMIDLQISHARKQMRTKRADLAWKELTAAAQWERADSPDAGLRINQGLVGLCLDQGLEAEVRLREGVELAGGGIAGWFRAALEEALLLPARQPGLAIVVEELDRAAKCEPERQQIGLIVAAMGASSVRAETKATARLIFSLRPWLQKASGVDLSAAEFHPLADMLLRAESYDLLWSFALAGKRREPQEPAWRFYEIVARTNNNPDWLHIPEEEELSEMQNKAGGRRDFHWFNRIQRYFESSGDDPAAKRRARRQAAVAEPGEEETKAITGLLDTLLDSVSPDEIRRLVNKLGRDKAIPALAARLGKSPVAAMAPGSAVAALAETIVDMVIGNDGGRYR
jgi:tetratricopeptide (TPR) repeat protein